MLRDHVPLAGRIVMYIKAFKKNYIYIYINISLMKAVQYTSVFLKPKYNNILQFNHKAVGVFLSFYIPAYIYIYKWLLFNDI